MTDYTSQVLARTLEILQERGWHERYNVCGQGALNIRSALTDAAVDTIPANWGKVYVTTAAVLNKELGGIQNWEYGVTTKKGRRPRNHDEVVAKLTEIIEKVNNHEVEISPDWHPYGRPGSRSPGKRPV